MKTHGIFSLNHSINPSFQETPLYNTLYGTNCSIPRGVRFVHYPMIHPVQFNIISFWKNLFKSVRVTDSFVDHDVSYSSFRFIQLIKQYPSSVVIDEMFIGRKEVALYRKLRYQYTTMTYGAPIAQLVFPDFVPVLNNLMSSLWRIKSLDSYEQLGSKEINILSQSTGGITVYILGLLDRLYPVTFLSDLEFAEMYFGPNGFNSLFDDRRILVSRLISLANRFNTSDDKIEKEKIKQSFYSYYQKLTQLLQQFSYYMMQWREQDLFDVAVNIRIGRRKFFDKPIIIAFGAAHDFEDNFAGKSFYTLPFSCTLLTDSLDNLLQIAVICYLEEESELNRDILRQFIEQQWSQMSLDQKNKLNQNYRNYTGSAVFVPISEIVRRILREESVSDEEKNFEFVFNFFIKMGFEEKRKFENNMFF